MATTDDLVALGFTSSSVAAVTLDLPHPDPFGMGPFCRLRVQTTAPQEPGVYAWVADGQVCYVGKAVEGYGLVQKVKGQRLGRAYDDYTYCPPSKALKQSQTRARVNGLLNASLVAGQVTSWSGGGSSPLAPMRSRNSSSSAGIHLGTSPCATTNESDRAQSIGSTRPTGGG